MKKLKVILLGAGSRGVAYNNVMLDFPEKFEVVALAEPNKDKVKYILFKGIFKIIYL